MFLEGTRTGILLYMNSPRKSSLLSSLPHFLSVTSTIDTNGFLSKGVLNLQVQHTKNPESQNL